MKKKITLALLLASLSFGALANPRWNEQEQRRIAQEEIQRERARERVKAANGGYISPLWDDTLIR